MIATILFWVLIIAVVFVAVLGVLLLIGSFLPRAHVVSRSIPMSQPRQEVWQVITDFANAPAWRGDVLRVERMPDRNGHDVWRETYQGNMGIQLETVEAVAPQRLVRLIADEKGPFSGRWEFALAETGSGSRVTITEHGVIPNPFFRLMARLFMDPAQYLEKYLRALAERFGEPVVLECGDV
jgi:uncharacterized protein YndB with AHSA1/START domain